MISSSRWPWQWRERALQSFTTVLLSLFFPLSYLLLLRLSAAQSHFYDFNAGPDDFLAFLFLYGNATILYALLALITFAAFVHGLTGGQLSLIKRLLLDQKQAAVDDQGAVSSHRLRWRSLSLAWLLVCTSLVFAELGIEFGLNGSTLSTSSYDHHHGLQDSFRGLLFVVGLYEIMLYWSKNVVKPVVEDAVMMMMGFTSSATSKEEEIKMRGVDTVGLGLSFGALWWWRLRDQVDSLMVTAAADDHVFKVADFVGFGLYYLTVSIGVIRAVTGVIWVGTGIMHQIRRTKIQKDLIIDDQAPAPAPGTVDHTV